MLHASAGMTRQRQGKDPLVKSGRSNTLRGMLREGFDHVGQLDHLIGGTELQQFACLIHL